MLRPRNIVISLSPNFIGRGNRPGFELRGGVHEPCMENYEIRIAKSGHQPVILAGPHTSDFAAVRRAQSLAQQDDEVEVWRELTCLYSTRAAGASHL